LCYNGIMIKYQLSFLSVLIIEDNEETRGHLVDVLQLYFETVLFAVDGCDGLKKVEASTPDVIISDIRMPCLNGIEFVKKIKKENYNPIIILSTAFSDKEYLLEALDIKVDAYLIKPINIEILIKKIEESAKDFISLDLRYKKLSVREYEVFLDLAHGLKPSEIARKYSIKAKTISTYRNRIFEKMLFKTNAELIAYAIKNKLIKEF